MIRADARHLPRRGLLVGLLLLGAGPARAEPAATVVLLRTRPGDGGRWRSAEERTRDELRMMGLQVTEVVVRDDPSEIERAMAEHGARAAVRLERTGEAGEATLWWAEADGARRAARLEGLATEGRAAAALAALRAAEMVRSEAQTRGGPRAAEAVPEDSAMAGGVGVPEAGPRDMSRPATAAVLEAGPRDMSRPATAASAASVPRDTSRPTAGSERDAGPDPTDMLRSAAAAPPDPRDSSDAGHVPPPPGPAEAGGATARSGPIDPLELVEAEPPPPPSPSTPRPTRGAIGLYAGVGGGPGGAGPLVGGGLALRGYVTRSLALQGELQGATSPGWISGQDTQLRVGVAGARAALVFVARREARVAWRLGLGGGLTLAWALARAPDRLRSQDHVAVAALQASVHAAIRAHDRLRVVLGVDVDLLAPPVAVRVRGVELARLGAPLLRGVLGLEWDAWPRGR